MINNTNSQENENNDKLMGYNPKNEASKLQITMTIEDVRRLAILKYGSIGGFARRMGITQPLGTRILNGGYVPLKPVSIQRIADCLEISPITLTRIYDELKEKKNQGVKNATP